MAWHGTALYIAHTTLFVQAAPAATTTAAAAATTTAAASGATTTAAASGATTTAAAARCSLFAVPRASFLAVWHRDSHSAMAWHRSANCDERGPEMQFRTTRFVQAAPAATTTAAAAAPAATTTAAAACARGSKSCASSPSLRLLSCRLTSRCTHGDGMAPLCKLCERGFERHSLRFVHTTRFVLSAKPSSSQAAPAATTTACCSPAKQRNTSVV